MSIKEKEVLFLMQGIRKSFSDVEVLHGIDFDLRKGEIHALIGENGAGKSTLSKIITANEKCDDGAMYFKGEKFAPEAPKAAIDMGIAMVHQEFNLAPALTIAQNIYLASEPKRGIFVDEAEMVRNAQEILGQLNLDVPVTTPVKYLTTYQQQLTEIAKCIASNSEIMILDEPTAPLSEKETKLLFKIMLSLKEKGIAILFISHRLEEIFQVSDRVSVMRDGNMIGTFDTLGVDRDMVIKCMIGRDLSQMFQYTNERKDIDHSEVVLRVTSLNSKKKRLKDITFELHKGEILGFAGLVGAGRSEVMRAIIGEDPFDSGTIEFKGKVIHKPSIRQLYDMGLGYVPEDRKRCGIIANLDVTANITLTVIPRFRHGFWVSARKEMQGAREIVEMLSVGAKSSPARFNVRRSWV